MAFLNALLAVIGGLVFALVLVFAINVVACWLGLLPPRNTGD